MRGRIGAMVAVISVAALISGCTTQEPGAPQREPYRALPLDSVTATMDTPVDGAIAYSPDGTLVVTRSQTGLCIGHSDNGGSDQQVCADLGTSVGQVLFSPDGSTLAAVEYYQQTFRGRLWLVSTGDGSARQVDWPQFAKPSSTPAPTPTTASSEGDGDPDDDPDDDPDNDPADDPASYLAVAWTEQGNLLALATGTVGMAATGHPAPGAGSEHLIQIDPGTARTTDLGEVAPGERRAAGTLIVGGGTALMTVLPRQRAPHELIAMDLATRKVRIIALTGEVITDHAQVLPLAVAPDGGSALLWVLDPVAFTRVPPARLDLGDGTVAPLDGAQGLAPTAGAYSPDGSQLALIASSADGGGTSLLVMPPAGGTPRSLVDFDDDLMPGMGLHWTRTDLLVPEPAAGALSLDGVAPVQLAG